MKDYTALFFNCFFKVNTPMPILTITPNPAIDQTVNLSSLDVGRVNVATQVRWNAGGKGVNVASCLADWGIDVGAAGFLGEDNAQIFEDLFAQKHIEDICQRVLGATRTNIKLVAADSQETTDVNVPGPQIVEEDFEGFLQQLRRWVEQQQNQGVQTLSRAWILMAGSLPRGLQPQGYGRMLEVLAQYAVRPAIALDASGVALDEALKAAQTFNIRLGLIKPNRHELEALLNQPLPSLNDLCAAARVLHGRCVDVVVVSLGDKGAVLSAWSQGLQRVWRAAPLPVQCISTVGAGDAQVAGLLAAFSEGKNMEDALRYGVGFATAKLGQLGPHLPEKSVVQDLIQQVQLEFVGAF